MTIQEKYYIVCNTPTDINEHLPTLRRYAEQCSHITEMGVCTVVSTWAFLAAKPKKFVSYDVVYNLNIEEALVMAQTEHIDFNFIEADVLGITIEETDLLFIDTFHHYLQLQRELVRHGNKARKFIIFHDTTLYESVNESLHYTVRDIFEAQGKVTTVLEFDNHKSPSGIMPAINEFISANPHWKIAERFTNNNGLLILKRD